MESSTNPDLFKVINRKSQLKQLVYRNTVDSINLIKKTITDLRKEYQKQFSTDPQSTSFIQQDKGEFEVHLQFAGDILIFTMHTNVFEFSRYHEVMSTSYIREDKERSYCGIINIYNFLADSFKYNRVNDVGYLIGRIFINKDKCYFVEGKREVGLLYNNFGQEVLDEKTARNIVESAILYTINFDLLTPPYDTLKEISLEEMQSMADSYKVRTGKRLGFRFQADKAQE